MNYRMIRKFIGSKGSIRDASSIKVENDKEIVLTVGCDRFLRIFDPDVHLKGGQMVGSCYLKQRLNGILLTN